MGGPFFSVKSGLVSVFHGGGSGSEYSGTPGVAPILQGKTGKELQGQPNRNTSPSLDPPEMSCYSFLPSARVALFSRSLSFSFSTLCSSYSMVLCSLAQRNCRHKMKDKK